MLEVPPIFVTERRHSLGVVERIWSAAGSRNRLTSWAETLSDRAPEYSAPH
ncbi:hypothetical protein J3R04_004301 [Spirilliplanes yamanashiensis]|nr:hypothetical protein [Spirilliplanes yamanashiensis]